MRRNRRGIKGDEIRSIINRVASCCIAFQCCRQIYRNTIRVSSLLSSLAVAIIMTTRNDAFVDFIGVCHEKVSSLLLRTTASVVYLLFVPVSASLNALRGHLVPVSRREARADSLQKCAYFLAKGMHFRFVDQLQHGLGIHERNRYGSIGFFAHNHVARK